MPLPPRKQRVLLDRTRRYLEELYGDYWGGLWGNFFWRPGGTILTASYADIQLRDAPAALEVADVLALREMRRLTIDEKDAPIYGDLVAIARPDLFRSRHAQRILAAAHRYRRLFQLGRWAFVDVQTGRCYWRSHAGGDNAIMRDYGVIARVVQERGTHAVMISGLSWISTWAAAQVCTDLHQLNAVHKRMSEKWQASKKGPHNGEREDIPADVPFEVLVEVSYEIDRQPPEYLKQFSSDTIRDIIRGESEEPAPPPPPPGASTRIYREEDLAIRPIEVLFGSGVPSKKHVLLALDKNDAPTCKLRLAKRFVVNGVMAPKTIEVPENRENMPSGCSRTLTLLANLWEGGAYRIGDLEEQDANKCKRVLGPRWYVSRAAQARHELNDSLAPLVGHNAPSLIASDDHLYSLNCFTRRDFTDGWTHVGLEESDVGKLPAPGFPK